LAHHWSRTGEAKPTFKYLELAGGAALRRGAYVETDTHLRAALKLDDETGRGVESARRASWHGRLGDAHEGLGHLRESHSQVAAALEGLGRRVPESSPGWAGLLLRELMVQLTHLTVPVRPIRSDSPRRERATNIMRGASLLAELCYFGNNALGMAASTLLAANHADRVGSAAGMARPYSVMASLASMANQMKLATRYLDRARRTALGTDDFSGLARVEVVSGSIYAWRGELDRAVGHLIHGEEVTEQYGLLREADMVRGVLFNPLLMLGRFHEHNDRASVLLDESRARSHQQTEIWALLALGHGYASLGDMEGADEVTAALRTQIEVMDHQERVSYEGIEVAVALRHADWDRVESASTLLATSLGIGKGNSAGAIVIPWHWAPFWSLDEACVALLSRAPRSHQAAAEAKVRAVQRAHASFAKRFRIAKPGALLFEGRAWVERGQHERAKKPLLAALDVSRRMGAQHAVATAQHFLALAKPEASQARSEGLRSVLAVYKALGCRWEQAEVRRIMDA
jgi:tetratricopeptide (TPR) repeat protein